MGGRGLTLLLVLMLGLSVLEVAVSAEPATAANFSCVQGQSVPGGNQCCNAHLADDNACNLPCMIDGQPTILHGFTVAGIVDVSTVSGCPSTEAARNCPAGGFFRRLFRRECRYTSDGTGSWTCTAGLGQTFLCEIIPVPE